MNLLMVLVAIALVLVIAFTALKYKYKKAYQKKEYERGLRGGSTRAVYR